MRVPLSPSSRVLFTLGLALPPPAVIRAPRTVLLSATGPRRRGFSSSSSQPPGLPPLDAVNGLSSTSTGGGGGNGGGGEGIGSLGAERPFAGDVTPRMLSEHQKKVVAYRQRYQCATCGCLLPPGYQVDHIRPLALGGTNGLTNLQALCTRCHTRKTRSQRHDVLAAGAARAEARQDGDTVATPGAGEAGGGGDEDATAANAEASKADAGVQRGAPEPTRLDAIELTSLKLLRGMNQQQLAAVVCSDGPMRVAAGPGTGKTRVLTARIAHLVEEQGVAPQRVLAVTFTNKAARELRERITALIGPDGAESITMGTFHSLCLAMLRADIERLPAELGYRRGFAVYDEYASLKLIRKLKERVEGGASSGGGVRTKEQKDKDELSAGAVQAIISAAKNDAYNATSFRQRPPSRQLGLPSAKLSMVTQVFELYERTMREENIIDFDDMLLLTSHLLRTSERTRRKYASHWRHIAVDEFQDTNSVQYQLLSLLGRDHGNVFVVGDVDQAIYGWRGADIRNQARLDAEFVIRPGAQVPAAALPPESFDSVASLKEAVAALPLPPLPRDGGRQLNRSTTGRGSISDMAYRPRAELEGRPASQGSSRRHRRGAGGGRRAGGGGGDGGGGGGHRRRAGGGALMPPSAEVRDGARRHSRRPRARGALRRR